jgi:4-hydroxybenzoate polyprenyltransferase
VLFKVHKYLIHYNFFIAFCSLALTKYFAVIFDSELSYAFYAFNFFGTLATYNYLRHYRSIKTFFSDRLSPRFRMILTSLLFTIAIYAFLPLNAKLYYLPHIILVAMYSFPCLKGDSLRSVPFVKIFIIALVWVLTAGSVLFFSESNNGITGKKIAFVVAQIFFFIAITLPFDIKDVIYDRIKTIPNTIGEKRSVQISVICLFIYIAIILLFGTNPIFKLAHVLFMLLALFVILKQKEMRKLYNLYYYIDGLILAQTGFMLVSANFLLK